MNKKDIEPWSRFDCWLLAPTRLQSIREEIPSEAGGTLELTHALHTPALGRMDGLTHYVGLYSCLTQFGEQEPTLQSMDFRLHEEKEFIEDLSIPYVRHALLIDPLLCHGISSELKESHGFTELGSSGVLYRETEGLTSIPLDFIEKIQWDPDFIEELSRERTSRKSIAPVPPQAPEPQNTASSPLMATTMDDCWVISPIANETRTSEEAFEEAMNFSAVYHSSSPALGERVDLTHWVGLYYGSLKINEQSKEIDYLELELYQDYNYIENLEIPYDKKFILIDPLLARNLDAEKIKSFGLVEDTSGFLYKHLETPECYDFVGSLSWDEEIIQSLNDDLENNASPDFSV